MSLTDNTVPANAPIRIGNAAIDVVAAHGPDWFPLNIAAGTRLGTTLYLRRDELRRLRDRLAEIDAAMPELGDKQ